MLWWELNISFIRERLLLQMQPHLCLCWTALSEQIRLHMQMEPNNTCAQNCQSSFQTISRFEGRCCFSNCLTMQHTLVSWSLLVHLCWKVHKSSSQNAATSVLDSASPRKTTTEWPVHTRNRVTSLVSWSNTPIFLKRGHNSKIQWKNRTNEVQAVSHLYHPRFCSKPKSQLTTDHRPVRSSEMHILRR